MLHDFLLRPSIAIFVFRHGELRQHVVADGALGAAVTNELEEVILQLDAGAFGFTVRGKRHIPFDHAYQTIVDGEEEVIHALHVFADIGQA